MKRTTLEGTGYLYLGHFRQPGVLGQGHNVMHGQPKVEKVMSEFSHGTLHSSSGEKVTNPAQAKAIAMSEAGLSREKRKG